MIARILAPALAAVLLAACAPQENAAPEAAPPAPEDIEAAADLPPANARGAAFPPPQPDPLLQSASLVEGGAVAAGAEVTLAFARPVRLIQVAVIDAAGETRILRFRGDETGTRYAVSLPELTPGGYQLSWAHEGGAGSRNFSVPTR